MKRVLPVNVGVSNLDFKNEVHELEFSLSKRHLALVVSVLVSLRLLWNEMLVCVENVSGSTH
jgi:hypothetical protein